MKKYCYSHIVEGIGSNSRGNLKIKQWIKEGINKVITWHMDRHTHICLSVTIKRGGYLSCKQVIWVF